MLYIFDIDYILKTDGIINRQINPDRYTQILFFE